MRAGAYLNVVAVCEARGAEAAERRKLLEEEGEVLKVRAQHINRVARRKLHGLGGGGGRLSGGRRAGGLNRVQRAIHEQGHLRTGRSWRLGLGPQMDRLL